MLFSSRSQEEKKQRHRITDKEEASLTANIAEEEAAVAHSHYRSRGTAATHLELLWIWSRYPGALLQTTGDTPSTLQLNLQTTSMSLLRHL
jgi:hypothetical protein